MLAAPSVGCHRVWQVQERFAFSQYAVPGEAARLGLGDEPRIVAMVERAFLALWLRSSLSRYHAYMSRSDMGAGSCTLPVEWVAAR